jgi:hypothetical protein
MLSALKMAMTSSTIAPRKFSDIEPHMRYSSKRKKVALDC